MPSLNHFASRFLLLLASVGGLALLGSPAARAAQPSTARVSLSSVGVQGNGDSSVPSISADGRWAVFASEASNLVNNDTNAFGDIFLRDRQTGLTVRVSVSAGGVQSNGPNDSPVLSADGRYIVFRSPATTLVPGTVSAGDRLYRYDRVTQSLLQLPRPAGMTLTYDPSISDDGARIAFAGVLAGRADIYWFDADTLQLHRVSETAGGAPADGTWSLDPDISGDGTWVGFMTDATNLVTPDTNGRDDILVRNLDTGAFARISGASGGGEANQRSSAPALDYDGCVVAFSSSATNLVAGDTGAEPKVFVRDRCAGTTEIASVSNAGTQGVAGTPVDISEDGCRVVFPAASVASPPASANNAATLRDRCTGTTSRLDLATNGDPGAGDVTDVSISGGTGRYVAFSTPSAGLVGGDSNGFGDTFVRDLATNVGPTAALAAGVNEQTVTADASGSRDPDGYALTSSIDYGDGSAPQAGLRGTHTYTRGGTYEVTVTVTDADGASASAAATVVVVVVAAAPPAVVPTPAVLNDPPATPPSTISPLVLDRVALSRARFAVVARGGKLDSTHGATLTLRLNAPATVTLTFERARSGRLVKGRCTAGAKKGTRCTTYAKVGTLTRALPAGTSSMALTGRLGTKVLAIAKHRLTVAARAADGRAASSKALSLTVVKAKAKAVPKAKAKR